MAAKRKTKPPVSSPKGTAHVSKVAGGDWLGRPLVFYGLLAALAVLAYLPALRAGFIWDDDSYVTENRALRDLAGLGQIWLNPVATPQYYPLVHTGFWVEYHLWGLHPLGYHVINVCLHALAAMLLACVLKHLQVPGAWLAAAIFAVHPVGVESVAWITERKNVLSAVFYFASALAYLRFEELGDAGVTGWRRIPAYGLALALFVAALLSKTVTCSLPVALLVVRWWKHGRLRLGDILALTPLFVLGAGLGLGTAWIEKHHVGAQGADWSLSLAQRCLIAGRALWFYAGKLAWPWRLVFVYPRWEVDPGRWWQWLYPVGAAAVVAGLWLGRHRFGRGPLAAVLFFLITLAPALGFVNLYPMRYSFVADHFQYLACVGLIAAAAVWLRRLPWAVQTALLLGLGALAWQREMAFHDIETLWRDTIAQNPDSWMPHNNLAIELEDQGRYDEAFDQAAAAWRLAPEYAETWNNMGNAWFRKGDMDKATANYRKAIELKPDYAAPWNSLGVISGMRGQYDEAIVCLRKSLSIKPAYARAHANLGNALKATGKLDEAISEYREALLLEPGNAVAHKNLGAALELKGLLDEATTQYDQALRLDGGDEQTHFMLGRVYARQGRREEAIAQFKEALRLRPGLKQAAEALQNLGVAGP
jgi:tetratricopeptide (TPR) repeat protein